MASSWEGKARRNERRKRPAMLRDKARRVVEETRSADFEPPSDIDLLELGNELDQLRPELSSPSP